jgi:hypothetical protein
MESPQQVLGLTVIALGAVIVLLILVVVWLSIRFYAENAKLHRDTSVLHSQIGDTMAKMVTLTQSTNDRAFSLMERIDETGLASRQSVQRQAREEAQPVVVEAVKQICDSVERVMSGLLGELAGQMTQRQGGQGPGGEGQLAQLNPAVTTPEDEQAAIDYRYDGGWDIIRWQGRIGPMAQGRVGEATNGILDDLGVQGARHIVLDLSSLSLLTPSAARAVSDVLEHAVDLGHRVRIVSGTPERSEQLWRMLSSNGTAELCPVYDSREEALALA